MKPKHITFLDDLLASVLTTIKVVLLSKFFIKKPFKLSDHQDCVLLGNGPSLKTFLEGHLDFLQDKAVFCVNNFVRTQAFPIVKPSYYVIVAPDFWTHEEKPHWKEERYKIFHELAEKTDWELILFVPVLAKKYYEWKKILHQNPKIKIAYFNNTPVEGLTSLSHFYFRKWLGMPRPHNVLVGTITIALNMDFKNCYITGADHSWLKEIIVADDNRVYLTQKHFYDDQLKSKTYTDVARPMYVGGTNRERRLHEILYKFYYSFRSYWELQNYAAALGIQIYNLSPGSYIDAFERKTLPPTHGQSATS